MAVAMKPIRRVVTGVDAQGRSRVLWDGPAPNVNVGRVAASAGMTDVWVFGECPATVRGERDEGRLPFSFEPPEQGGHLRIVHSAGKPPDYDPAQDACAVAPHAPRKRPDASTWDRGGQNAYSSPIHRSETVDVGVLVEGKRTLLLDDGAYPLEPGDCVVQLRNWHGWTNPDAPSLMAFMMMGGGTDDEHR
jgi:hypothetical protein